MALDILLRGADPGLAEQKLVRSASMIAALGSIEDESEFVSALGELLSFAGTVDDEDYETAMGALEVLGAVRANPMMARMRPILRGQLSAQEARMQAIMRAGTLLQAQDNRRPDSFILIRFTNPAAGTSVVENLLPALPGVPGTVTGRGDNPLTLMQVTATIESGALGGSDLNVLVDSLPLFQTASPTGQPLPAGLPVARFTYAAYQAGLMPPFLRGTDQVNNLTRFTLTYTTTAASTMTLCLEFKAQFSFSAGMRCLPTRNGPSLIRGPGRITAPQFYRNR